MLLLDVSVLNATSLLRSKLLLDTPQTMTLLSGFRPRSARGLSLRHRSNPRHGRRTKNHDPSEIEVEDDSHDPDAHSIITPSKHTPKPFRALRGSVSSGGPLRPFRLVKQDIMNLRRRYVSDWTVFNQLIIASAVYVFFTNLLPGITFASDLYVLTGKNWGTIEVVFSTGICGIIFSLYVPRSSCRCSSLSLKWHLTIDTRWLG